MKLSNLPNGEINNESEIIVINGDCSYKVSINDLTQFICENCGSYPFVDDLNCASLSPIPSLQEGVFIDDVITIPYFGGNAESYPSITYTSYGVFGLSLILESDTLNDGSGNLTFNLVGTPQSSGDAKFNVSFGGQTCVIAFSVVANDASIDSLDCISSADSVSAYIDNNNMGYYENLSNIPVYLDYTNGNGLSYDGLFIQSQGVTGLSINFPQGVLENGNGTLLGFLNGTASGQGVASFPIDFGGVQCSIELNAVLKDDLPIADFLLSDTIFIDCSNKRGYYVELDSSLSTTPNLSIDSYLWEIVNKPTNSQSFIVNEILGQTAILVDTVGQYTIRLTIVDNEGLEDSKDVSFNVQLNDSWGVNAGVDQETTNLSTQVRASIEPECYAKGRNFTYLWEDLNSDFTPTIVNPTFDVTTVNFPQSGSYTLQVTAIDEFENIRVDQVTVIVSTCVAPNLLSVVDGTQPNQVVFDWSLNGQTYNNGILLFQYSLDAGSTWTTATTVNPDGSSGNSATLNDVPDNSNISYRIIVQDDTCSEESNVFNGGTWTNDTVCPSPILSEITRNTANNDITYEWDAYIPIDPSVVVDLQYSINNGSSWNTIQAGVDVTLSQFTVTMPAITDGTNVLYRLLLRNVTCEQVVSNIIGGVWEDAYTCEVVTLENTNTGEWECVGCTRDIQYGNLTSDCFLCPSGEAEYEWIQAPQVVSWVDCDTGLTNSYTLQSNESITVNRRI